MHPWQVRETVSAGLTRPNHEAILGIDSIWPRASTALAAYFAFVAPGARSRLGAAAQQQQQQQHRDPASPTNASAASSSGSNANIGRSLAAQQIARHLSLAAPPQPAALLVSPSSSSSPQQQQDRVRAARNARSANNSASACCFSSGDDDDDSFVAAANASMQRLVVPQQGASRASATSNLQLQSPLRSVTNPTGSALRDMGGEDVMDLPHVALLLPTQEIAVIDRDLARVHVFAPNASLQHRTLLAGASQLVGPLGGCVTNAGHLVVCDMVGASVVLVDPVSGQVRVRWLGSRSGVVPEIEMRQAVTAFRAHFAMPKDAVEIPVFSSASVAGAASSAPGGDASLACSSSPTNTVLVVSDYASGCLLLLHCGTGNWKSVGIGAEVKPSALCYDAAMNTLFVSCENKNRLYMYRASDIAQHATSLQSRSTSTSATGTGSSVAVSPVGFVDLHELLGAQLRSGPAGIATIGDGQQTVIVSNPGQANVLCFSDLLGGGGGGAAATKMPPRWGAFRNGRNLFAFPSGITACPYGSIAVVARNSGFVHFMPVSAQQPQPQMQHSSSD